MVINKAISHYQQMGIETALISATPHRLIQMLFEGLLSNLSALKGALKNNNYDQIALHIRKSSNILVGLEEGLDLDKGQDIARNLKDLYGYMQVELISLQLPGNEDRIEGLFDLVTQLKSAWDDIEPK